MNHEANADPPALHRRRVLSQAPTQIPLPLRGIGMTSSSPRSCDIWPARCTTPFAMRPRTLLLLAIPLLLAGCFTLRPPSLAGITDLVRSAEWEYRQEIDCRPLNQSPSATATARTDMLNRLGKSRWELVSIEAIETLPAAAEAARGAASEECAVFTFKRRAD